LGAILNDLPRLLSEAVADRCGPFERRGHAHDRCHRRGGLSSGRVACVSG
jgi:hypothetical protein